MASFRAGRAWRGGSDQDDGFTAEDEEKTGSTVGLCGNDVRD